MPEISLLPTINAMLNFAAACFLFAGWRAVKRGNLTGHWRNMTTALSISALFLGCYLYYHYMVGSVKYEGSAFMKTIYLIILIPHVILATLQVPAILAAVITALKKNFELHRKITRILWPVWMYVSVTGVMVYVMLYVIPHGI